MSLYIPYLKKKERFLELRQQYRAERLEQPIWGKYSLLKEELLKDAPKECRISLQDNVNIFTDSYISGHFRKKLFQALKTLVPWRTGPFSFFDLKVDSEWRSYLRWQRLKPFLPDLKDMIVADVGCGNGYFMFRMLEQRPKFILGLDPQPRCIFQFELLNSFLNEKRICAEPLGIEDMQVFYRYFNFVLCMGVIYHRRDPHTCLTKLRESMQPGGKLLIESLVIPGEKEVSLSPAARYMKMRNVWFVPTANCLASWLEKVGFKDIQILLKYDLENDEQRRTEFSPDESLADFLDPHDPTKTIEGYELPQRAILSAIA